MPDVAKNDADLLSEALRKIGFTTLKNPKESTIHQDQSHAPESSTTSLPTSIKQ
jgi:hypothetical protein